MKVFKTGNNMYPFLFVTIFMEVSLASQWHLYALVKPRPLASPYFSINLMKRSHSSGLFMTMVLSMEQGLPLTKRALTSLVDISPSSSTRNIPVMSPSAAVEASNTFGASKLKVAVPDEPSVARVSLISGITFSGRPLTNSIEAPAMERVDADREAGLEGANAEARAGTEATRMVVNFMLENFKTRMFVAVYCELHRQPASRADNA